MLQTITAPGLDASGLDCIARERKPPVKNIGERRALSLKRIHIKGYKSLEDVEIELPRLALLFGPNASGKTNFLDALQLLSRFATSWSLKEGFGPPYRGKPLESFSRPQRTPGAARP